MLHLMAKAASVGCFAAMVAAFFLLSTGCKKPAPPPPPPPKVEVYTVIPRTVPIYREWVGTLEGYVTAQVRGQVTGYLMSQEYQEGGFVKKGDLLFRIDPRPFQAVLDQAKGRLAQDQAQYKKAQLDVERYTPLVKEGALSQEELVDASQAEIAAEAALKADQASIEAANLNLGFTRIQAPIDGIAGQALAQIGDLITPGGNVLTTVSTLDPMRVYFNVSETFYLEHRRQFANAEDRAKHQADLAFELILADGSVYPHPGKFFFENRQVDVTTGTIQVAVLFPNPELILRPGGYARVRAQSDTVKNALVVPQAAVNELQSAYQVALVGESNKVHLQMVTVGEQVGSDWIIESGLHPNDRVIVEGTQKASEGAVVAPEPYTNAPPANGQPGAGMSPNSASDATGSAGASPARGK